MRHAALTPGRAPGPAATPSVRARLSDAPDAPRPAVVLVELSALSLLAVGAVLWWAGPRLVDASRAAPSLPTAAH